MQATRPAAVTAARSTITDNHKLLLLSQRLMKSISILFNFCYEGSDTLIHGIYRKLRKFLVVQTPVISLPRAAYCRPLVYNMYNNHEIILFDVVNCDLIVRYRYVTINNKSVNNMYVLGTLI